MCTSWIHIPTQTAITDYHNQTDRQPCFWCLTFVYKGWGIHVSDPQSCWILKSLEIYFKGPLPFWDRVSCISVWPQTHYTSRNDLKLLTLLPSTLECWHCICLWPCLEYTVSGIKGQASCMLVKCFIDQTIFPILKRFWKHRSSSEVLKIVGIWEALPLDDCEVPVYRGLWSPAFLTNDLKAVWVSLRVHELEARHKSVPQEEIDVAVQECASERVGCYEEVILHTCPPTYRIMSLFISWEV